MRIVRTATEVPVRLTGGCALQPEPFAAWYVGAEEDPSDFIFFGGEATDTWSLYSFTRLGTRT